MDVNVIALVGFVGTICSILFGYIGYQRGIKKEAYEDGVSKADAEYMKRRLDETLIEMKETNRNMTSFNERLTRVEESAKQAHKRIDQLHQN